MMRIHRLLLLSLLMAAGCARPAPAPAIAPVPEIAIVHGCVRDPAGYAVPGAIVEIHALELRTVTNDTGCYLLRSPRSGVGEIRFARVGYLASTSRRVTLRAGEVIRYDARLQPLGPDPMD